MKKLEDKLAASIKPERGKTPASAKPKSAEEQKPAKSPAGARQKDAEDQGSAKASANAKPGSEEQAPKDSASAPAKQETPAMKQGGSETKPVSDGADLNDAHRPLHPKRIWPD